MRQGVRLLDKEWVCLNTGEPQQRVLVFGVPLNMSTLRTRQIRLDLVFQQALELGCLDVVIFLREDLYPNGANDDDEQLRFIGIQTRSSRCACCWENTWLLLQDPNAKCSDMKFKVVHRE